MIVVPIQAFASSGQRHPLFWPYCISFGAHLLVLGFFIFSPVFKPESSSYLPSVIDVQMVDLSQVTAAPAAGTEKAEVKQEVAQPPEKKPEPVAMTPPAAAAQPEVSVAPVRKETKSALKYKTFKPEKVVKNSLQRVEKKVESLPPKTLEDTIKRLRDKVAKEGEPTTGIGGEAMPETKATGKGIGFGRGSQKEIEQIDLYRLEVAYAVNKNWAFAEQLAGGDKQLAARIAFKIMPDGKITDIFFTDRSGNTYLDDSAYKAIVKSSPVKPFPPGLNRPFLEMGLNFTPKGVR